jgi:hypothetical protein
MVEPSHGGHLCAFVYHHQDLAERISRVYKSAAINRTTGVGKQLRDMLMVWCRCLNKLLVGSLEYKEIIEADQELVINLCRLQ